MAVGTVRIKGLKETVRAFNKIDRSLTREVQKGLKKAAEPVAKAGIEKISRYTGASTGTIGPRAAGASVFVTQRARKVSGLRGDFGSLQMRRLEEALFENQDEVITNVEHVLDELTDSAGF